MGGGGKGGGGGGYEPWELSAQDDWSGAGYNYGFSGGEMPTQGEGGQWSFPMPYDTQDPWAPWWEGGYAQGRADWQKEQMMGQLSHMMSGGAAPHAPSGPSLAEQRAAAERAQGENRRDMMVSEYMDSADLAASYVNSQITQEISNANLMGIDYDITEENKQARVSNYFASIWGEGQDAETRALVDKWGLAKGFEGFTLERGDSSMATGTIEGTETDVGRTKPKPPPVPDEDAQLAREDLLGTGGLLG